MQMQWPTNTSDYLCLAFQASLMFTPIILLHKSSIHLSKLYCQRHRLIMVSEHILHVLFCVYWISVFEKPWECTPNISHMPQNCYLESSLGHGVWWDRCTCCCQVDCRFHSWYSGQCGGQWRFMVFILVCLTSDCFFIIIVNSSVQATPMVTMYISPHLTLSNHLCLKLGPWPCGSPVHNQGMAKLLKVNKCIYLLVHYPIPRHRPWY